MTEQKFKPGSLLKRAFLNQYNAILLGTTGLFAATTQSWLPLLVGGGAEVLWLVLGPDAGFFKRWVLSQESQAEQERIEARKTDALHTLDPWYLQRYERLQSTSAEIGQLSKENQSIENELLEVELGKIGALLAGYLKMAVVHQRLGRFLSENQRPHIERDIEHCQRGLAHEKNARLRTSLEQALQLAQRRLEQQEQLDASFKSLGIEMDTLEKSLGFLKSRVLSLSSREELGAELDTMVNGVGTIDELDRETDKMLAELRTARVANQRSVARA